MSSSPAVTTAPAYVSSASHTDVIRPINLVLDETNYLSWSQQMRWFLQGRKLWGVISGTTREPSESDVDYATRVADWEADNAKILSWIANTTPSKVNQLFGSFKTAKDVWDYLAATNTVSDLSSQYQIDQELFRLRQAPGQSVHDYYSVMAVLWDKQTHPTQCTTCVIHYNSARDNKHLRQFLMGLLDEYEDRRSSLLNRTPAPTLAAALAEIKSEETRKKTAASLTLLPGNISSQNVLATSQSTSQISGKKWCYYHKTTNHNASECRTLKYRDQNKNKYPSNSAAVVTDNTPSTESSSLTNMQLTSDELALIAQLRQSQPNDTNGSNTTNSSFNSSSALSTTTGTSHWLLDSACCNHMTSDPHFFSHKTPTNSIPPIHTADGTILYTTHVGSISTSSISAPNTYLLPSLKHNLLSAGQIVDLGYRINLNKFGCFIQDDVTGKVVGIGRKVGRLFLMDQLHLPSISVAAASVSSNKALELWHSRLGHASLSKLRPLFSSGQLGQSPVSFSDFKCLPCQLSKQTKLPFNNSESRATASFDLIHSDVWGPSPVLTMGGSRYFVIFVDDFSRFTWVYVFKHRSEILSIYSKFCKMVQTQFSRSIKIFRSDNAGEYTSTDFLNLLAAHGTIAQTSCPGTSEQNGRAERKHRHVVETAGALLRSASLPQTFWGEAVLTSIFTINRTPSAILDNKTPYECLFNTSPNYNLLRIFGCVCFVQLHPHERTKLEPRSRMCCFLGYGIGQKGYRCFDPISKNLRVSRHVIFWENIFFTKMASIDFITNQQPAVEHLFVDPFADTSHVPHTVPLVTPPTSDSHFDPPAHAPAAELPSPPNNNPSAHIVPINTSEVRTSSGRVVKPNVRFQDYHCYFALATLHEPTTFKEASANPVWQKAMTEELDALTKSNTWDLVDLPPSKSVVGCKWVYKIKTRADGSIERHKARLVAKGYTQEYGIDYEETFAPVARLTSVRALIAVASARKWSLFQMDVKNAFLNGDLSEEVYMKPPPGYPHFPHQVCRLRKALYGLKQAPRAWFSKFSYVLSQLGFHSSAYDSALFRRQTNSGLTIVLLYVDDMIITGDDISGIHAIKFSLSKEFEMKDLGKLSYFLGLEVNSNTSGYYLSQTKYASELISKSGISDSDIVQSPMEENWELSALGGEPLRDPTLYRQLVGSLIYLTITRPDISYAVHRVSQFMSSPRTVHFAAILRILRYVKGTIFHGLFYSCSSSLQLTAYSDADWGRDPGDRRSTTGFCFFLGDSLISWRSKKQTIVSRSSTESEYRALADTTTELIWLRWLLGDMGVSFVTPTLIHCDSQSAIQVTRNDVFHERTKHIEIDCHITRTHLTRGTLRLTHVSSSDQLADIFTKSFSVQAFKHLVSKLKLVSSQPS